MSWLLACSSSAVGQSISPIGWAYPWSGAVSGEPIAMRPDGEWIAFAETPLHFPCLPSILTHQLSIVRPDGTGYRVVLDVPTLSALWPSTINPNRIEQIRWAGNTDRLVFWWYDLYAFTCGEVYGPLHYYLVDVAAGTVEEFTFNGLGVDDVSFTDDGQTMVFLGWDPVTQSYPAYRAGPSGEDAVPFLYPLPGDVFQGIVSGDGSRFLWLSIDLSSFDYLTDVYVYDFASQQSTKLTQAPVDNLSAASLSYDGGRIVYSDDAAYPELGKIIGVNADGSDYHEFQIPLTGADSTTTLTRDGQHVFFGTNSLPFGECYRVAWDGSGMQLVSNFFGQTFGYLHEIPVNHDGSLQAHWFQEPVEPPFSCLAIAALDQPWLTTYPGYTSDEDVIWDVAGQPGDHWILAWATATADLPLGSLGTLGLDPSKLRILATGTIGGPYNVGTVKVGLPPDLPPIGHVPLYFQALVKGEGGGQLTNVTTLQLDSVLDAPGPQPAAATRPSVPPARYVPTEHERWLRFLASDPMLWRMYGEALVPK